MIIIAYQIARITKTAESKLERYKEKYQEHDNGIIRILISKYAIGQINLKEYIDHSKDEFVPIMVVYTDDVFSNFLGRCTGEGKELHSVISCLIEQEL